MAAGSSLELREVDKQEIERLREAAHNAPLAKIYEDHRGRKSIGIHTDAWWKASREYATALAAQVQS